MKMSVVAHITNTRANPLTLMYRVPKNPQREEASRPIISIALTGRAFRTPVAFASEEHFVAFKVQNAELLSNGTILLGDKVKEKDAEKVNEANASVETKEVRAKKAKTIKSLESAVNTKNTSLKIEVEKES